MLGAASEPIHDAGAKPFHEDVGAPHQPMEGRSRCLLLQVEDDAFLSRIDDIEQAPHPAGGVTFGRLDLDDLGAERRQDVRRVRPGEVLGEIENANSR